MLLEPTTAEETAECVRSHARVLPVGAGTKPRLGAVPDDVTRICMHRVAGITEYDPGEFTFTALAGTPVREIVTALAAQGQYLPFDPVLMNAGATLGGTVAAGLNGPGRIRYGGIRDFILAVQFVDGTGQLLRGGAKVVKNAAGFDFPKFLVGSLGRFGVLVELTFKVFPRPAAWLTLCAPTPQTVLAARLSDATRGRWEIEALEYDVHEGLLYARIGGPAEANDVLARELCDAWPGSFVLAADRAQQWWRDTAEFAWATGSDALIKVPTTLADLSAIFTLPADCRARIGGAGSCAWLTVPSAAFAGAKAALAGAGLTGLVVRGEGTPLFLSPPAWSETQRAVQGVFDPCGRFAAF
jgi:glycolate oxidase FAD binding subunit